MTAVVTRNIDSRYTLIEKLGEGGMGEVYRARDGLTREIVALKQVRIAPDTASGFSDSDGLRLALAQEFHTLASLRHPNIISVLDYGFDEERQPYYTMDFLEAGKPLLEAAEGQPFSYKMNLLVQMLQAVAYLHRRGVIHRDLKPANVLVANGQVKVLDFGLSLGHDAVEHDDSMLTGTLAYIAPEVLRGQRAREAADLYAIGVMAYELFVGRHPFDISNAGQLIAAIISQVPDLTPLLDDPSAGAHTIEELSNLETKSLQSPDNIELNTINLKKDELLTRKLDTFNDGGDVVLPHTPSMGAESPSLAQIIGQLLSKESYDRYQSAEVVITHLLNASDLPIPTESPAIRESYLQAARFIGRDTELDQLKDALSNAQHGDGGAWLVAGESGVGKSRLLDELRTQALVGGFLVLRGQAVAEGGLPYQLWREPLRRLALGTALSDVDAGILRDIVPDIADLQGRTIPDTVALEGQDYQQRLFGTIADIFQNQNKPVLLLLEDLQWSRESLDVLGLLKDVAPKLRLLVVASYRDDERPELPETLPGMQLLKLERLTHDQIASLSESMLGQTGRLPQLVQFLQQETEGNIYFLVEVVRALAEEAGRLDQVGRVTLPQYVMAGGIQAIVERRLARVPAGKMELLRLAAVAGRELDLTIMEQFETEHALDEWLVICANCAVLEVHEDQWRFSHDKLRRAAIDMIPAAELPDLHRQVAQALEVVHGTAPDQAATIARHWAAAGDVAKEFEVVQRAGDYALRISSFSEAITHYERAYALLPEVVTDAEEQQKVQARLLLKWGEALQHSGDYVVATTKSTQSLELYFVLEDQAGIAQAMSLRADIFWRSGDHTSASQMCTDSLAIYRASGDRHGEARALNRLGMIAIEQGNYEQANTNIKLALEIAEDLQDDVTRSTGLNNLGLVALRQGDFANAVEYFKENLAMCRASGERWRVVAVLLNLGTLSGIQGDLGAAGDYFRQALDMSRIIGDRRGMAQALNNLGFVAQLQGEYDAAATYLEESLSLAQAIGNRQGSAEILVNLGHVATAQNDARRATELFYQALSIAREIKVAPLMLESLYGLARIEESPSRALAWLTLVLNHPATTHETRDMATKLSEQINADSSPEVIETATTLGSALNLDALVDDLLRS
ncbi:MAG: tetratricopeptide repeat protein [Anaerolineae bacterium]